MNFMTRGVRNAFRNYTRTIALILILGLSLGLSLSMFVAHKAVNNRISLVKSSVGNYVSIEPAGFSNFSQVNNALSLTELNQIKMLPHVSSITENLTDRLLTNGTSQLLGNRFNSSNNGTTSLTSPVTLNFNRIGHRFFIEGGGASLPTNFSLPITILGTTTPNSLNGTELNIISGTTPNGAANNNTALISRAMALNNNLKIGSIFSAYNTNITVSGIFKSTNQSDNNTVIVPLATEQSLSGQSGVITSATVYVDSLDNLSSVTQQIKNKLGSNADVISSIDQANQTVQPLDSVKSISLYSAIGAVVAAAIIIFMTMIMIVRERRREIGVLKAIGANNIKIASQFIVEAITLTFLAYLFGIIIGVIFANPITHLLVSNSSPTPQFGRGIFRQQTTLGRSNLTIIHTVVGWSILVEGLLAAILIAIIASSLASLTISKIRPAEIMRTE